MQITEKAWNNYIKKLSAVCNEAGTKMKAFVAKYGLSNQDALLRYAMRLVQQYGEGSAALACEMYDEIAALSGADVPPAEPAEVASQHDVAKGIMGSLKQSPSGQLVDGVVSRYVKQAGADTTLKNAKRDRCEFAWIPSGDTCAFCFVLASAGWKKAGPKTIKGDHAEHIHAHCDCQYCIRFDSSTNVAGYDPDAMRDIYDNAEGKTSKEKINSIRRRMYAENKNRGIIKPTKTVSGHGTLLKESEPGDVIDHEDRDGNVDIRRFYGDSGLMEKDIHTDAHGNYKAHNFGEHGEHAHDYEFDDNGRLKNKSTRELTDDERKENGDIL